MKQQSSARNHFSPPRLQRKCAKIRCSQVCQAVLQSAKEKAVENHAARTRRNLALNRSWHLRDMAGHGRDTGGTWRDKGGTRAGHGGTPAGHGGTLAGHRRDTGRTLAGHGPGHPGHGPGHPGHDPGHPGHDPGHDPDIPADMPRTSPKNSKLCSILLENIQYKYIYIIVKGISMFMPTRAFANDVWSTMYIPYTQRSFSDSCVQ